MKIATAQLRTVLYEIDENEKKILSLIGKAREEGVDLILFPEGINLGYFVLDRAKSKDQALSLALQRAPSLSSTWVNTLKEEAGKGIHIACGNFLKVDKGTLVNTLLLVSPTGEVVTYNKTHLYHEKDVREEDFVKQGDELKVVDTALGKIGLAICYDLNFPEVMRKLTLKGAEIILISAAWPKLGGGAWDMLLPARAFENEAYVIASNHTGGDFYGHSKIVDYMGRVVAEFELEEGLRIAEIDLGRLRKWRNMITFLQDRRPELYGE